MAKYERQKSYAKSVAIVLAGGAVGVIAEKLVNDAVTSGQVPNPTIFSTVQLFDVIQAGTEFVAGYYVGKSTRKRSQTISKFLVGMGSSVVVADVYQWVAQQPAWLRAGTANLARNASMGRYGNPVNYSPMSYVGTTYPRR